MPHRRDGGRQHDEAAAGDPGRPLGGDEQHHQQGELLEQIQRRIGRLSDEDGRHGQVDGGAIQVEGVTGRDHQAHHRLLAAERLHLHQHARQYGFGRGGAQHDQQLFPNIGNKAHYAEAICPGNAAQHHEDE
ncbi:hypothetical protein D3C79_717550 [compost metagenome]